MLVWSDLPWAGGALDPFCIVLLDVVSQIRERYAVALLAQLMICCAVICICSPACMLEFPLLPLLYAVLYVSRPPQHSTPCSTTCVAYGHICCVD
jgi:hypothetical protein